MMYLGLGHYHMSINLQLRTIDDNPVSSQQIKRQFKPVSPHFLVCARVGYLTCGNMLIPEASRLLGCRPLITQLCLKILSNPENYCEILNTTKVFNLLTVDGYSLWEQFTL